MGTQISLAYLQLTQKWNHAGMDNLYYLMGKKNMSFSQKKFIFSGTSLNDKLNGILRISERGEIKRENYFKVRASSEPHQRPMVQMQPGALLTSPPSLACGQP